MPENVELTIHKGIAHLTPSPQHMITNRSSIDIFFCSLAEDDREKAMGVIFSGTGTEGSQGVIGIHKFNGKVYVQDARTVHFASMPESAILADHPNFIDTSAVLVWIVSEEIANAKTYILKALH